MSVSGLCAEDCRVSAAAAEARNLGVFRFLVELVAVPEEEATAVHRHQNRTRRGASAPAPWGRYTSAAIGAPVELGRSTLAHQPAESSPRARRDDSQMARLERGLRTMERLGTTVAKANGALGLAATSALRKVVTTVLAAVVREPQP